MLTTVLSIKLHGKPMIAADKQTDRWTDIKKLLGDFRDYAKTPKNVWPEYIGTSEYNIKMNRKYMHSTDMTWTDFFRNKVQRKGCFFSSRWWTLQFHNRGILSQLSEYRRTQVPVSFSWSGIVRGKPNCLEKNVSNWHFVGHKSDRDWHGFENVPPWRQTGN